MHHRFLIPLYALLCAGLPGRALHADDKPAEAGKHQHHHHPSVPGVQSLDVQATATGLHLLTYELAPDGSPLGLLYRTSTNRGAHWTSPVRVDTDQPPPFAAARGVDPQVAASGQTVVAIWMTAGTDAFGGGPMASALSTDGGKTWTKGPNPADDGSTTGHGFLDVVATRDGVFHLTWLDTREGKRGLRHARSTDGGRSWSKNDTADAETCECCWNAIATGPDGKVGILYRDKGPRDMAVAWCPEPGKDWPAPVNLGGFQWEFQGCPHVGGGLAAGGTAELPVWHAVVWTGKEDSVGIHYLASLDGGTTWTRTTRLADKRSTHPDLAAAGRSVMVVCDVGSKEGSRISSLLSPDGGRTWQAQVWLSDADTVATHPRVVAVGDGYCVFWTEQKGAGPVLWKSRALSAAPDAATASVGGRR